MTVQPYELSDAELDAVAAGVLVTGGLVNVTIDDLLAGGINVDNVLNNFGGVANDSIKDFAKNNNVGVGAIIQALGGGAVIRGTQTQ